MRRLFVTGVVGLIVFEIALVLGIKANGRSKAYDWNRLRLERVVNDQVGGVPTPRNVSQEFWHSWRTFQPQTERY